MYTHIQTHIYKHTHICNNTHNRGVPIKEDKNCSNQ